MSPSTSPFKTALRATATGSATVLLSTVASCAFAIVIEAGAHKLQYKFFPHWYDGKVKYALGLPHLRHQRLDSDHEHESQSESELKLKSEGKMHVNVRYHDHVKHINGNEIGNASNSDEHIDNVAVFHLQETNTNTNTPIRIEEQKIVMLGEDASQSNFQFYELQSVLQEKKQELELKAKAKAQSNIDSMLIIQPDVLMTAAMTG